MNPETDPASEPDVSQPATEVPQDIPPATEPVAEKPAEKEAEEEAKPETEEQEHKPKSGYARLKARSYERDARQQAEIAALKEQLAKATQKEPEPEREPKIEDFNGDYLAHGNAMNAYWAAKGAAQAVDAKLGQFVEQQEQHRAATEYRNAVEQFSNRLHETAEKYGIKNIDAAASTIVDELGALPQTLTGKMLDAENAAPIISYLAKNLDYAADIYGMSPGDQLFELGKLEGRLSLPKAKTETSAPPPMKTPSGGATPPSDVFKIAARSEDISDYVKARKAAKD